MGQYMGSVGDTVVSLGSQCRFELSFSIFFNILVSFHTWSWVDY